MNQSNKLLCAAAAAVMTLAFAASAQAYEAVNVTDGGVISGVVKFDGVPPEPARLEVSKDRDVCGSHPLYDQSLEVARSGGIKNAVVTITGISRGEAFKPAPEVKFDQRGCKYAPHVAVFPAGSTVEIINSDGILHSIHTESVINPVVDMAQPGFKKTIRVKIEKPEAIKVTCDAHNWMLGWWYVTANPYYAITGANGRYSITNVPPGTYTVQVWQEKLGTLTQKVRVEPAAGVSADFTMKPKKG
jgi:plastocyanin